MKTVGESAAMSQKPLNCVPITQEDLCEQRDQCGDEDRKAIGPDSHFSHRLQHVAPSLSSHTNQLT